MEIFKSRFADGHGQSGFTPAGKRSMSGSLLPYPTPSRANSVGFFLQAFVLVLLSQGSLCPQKLCHDLTRKMGHEI